MVSKKHKVLHSKEVKKAITSIKQMKGWNVRASERQVKNNEANPRQASRKKPQKASQPWLIEGIGDRPRTTMKNRTRQRIKWCPMWDNMDEKKNWYLMMLSPSTLLWHHSLRNIDSNLVYLCGSLTTLWQLRANEVAIPTLTMHFWEEFYQNIFLKVHVTTFKPSENQNDLSILCEPKLTFLTELGGCHLQLPWVYVNFQLIHID